MKLYYLLIFIFLIPLVNAQINFETNQSEYYFQVNENAIIPIRIINDFNQEIQGMITSTTISKVEQGNSFMQQTNSNSQSFIVPKDNQVIGFEFGSANTPTELIVSIKYDYFDPNNNKYTLNMPDLKIHFVQDQNQKQNKQNKQKSSTQSEKEKSEQAKKEAEQRKKDLENQMKQQQKQNELQNRLQNNQVNQDTSSIKNEINDKEKTNQEFEKQLSQNKEFKQNLQELKQENYDLLNQNIQSNDGKNGEFNLEFQDKEGNKANLKGNIQNQTISIELKKDKDLLNKLKQNSKFNKFNNSLIKDNFKFNNTSIKHQRNQTTIIHTYKKQNQTAKIISTFKNDTLKNIKLERSRNYKFLIYLFLITIIILIYLLYNKYKPQKEIIKNNQNPIFNYKQEAQSILNDAIKLFEKKQYKDAYGKAAQSVRFFYCHKLKLNKELTNTELIKILRRHNLDSEKLQDCLNTCGLVEFAKYQANKEDFNLIIKTAKELINYH